MAHREDYETLRTRRRSPSPLSERKRLRSERVSSEGVDSLRTSGIDRSWDREAYEASRRITSAHVVPVSRGPEPNRFNAPYGRRRSGYDNGGGGFTGHGAPGIGPGPNGIGNISGSTFPRSHGGSGVGAGVGAGAPALHNSKSRRLYIGNVPFHAGLTDVALTQFFSALYVAGFGGLAPGAPLPVVSFWLHADGKFGFMELRGEQETVNMMVFNQTTLHGRLLKVNRPSDFRPEIHAPHISSLIPDTVNACAVVRLCEELDGLAVPPPRLIAQAQIRQQEQGQNDADPQTSVPQPDDSAPVDDTDPRGAIKSDLVNKESVDKSTISPSPSGADSKTEGDNNSEVDNEGNMDVDDVEKKGNDVVVISLRNLVTDADLDGSDEDYREIVEDVHGECSQYGDVASVEIPRDGPWKGTAFVQFRESSGALRAIEELARRVFEGRRIIAVGVPDVSTAQEAVASKPAF